ncbi:MAG: hypothetical protein ACRD7E_19690, partial [Bryobacteraceae bacterium]
MLSRLSVQTEAWAAYKRAFRDFSEKVQTFQHQAAKPEVTRLEIEAAILAVEKARLAYRSARDAVAEQLLASPPGNVRPAALELSPVHTAE